MPIARISKMHYSQEMRRRWRERLPGCPARKHLEPTRRTAPCLKISNVAVFAITTRFFLAARESQSFASENSRTI